MGRRRADQSTELGMAAERERIALFGNFGTGNTGNDGSLESVLLSLRRMDPQVRLCCICGNTAAVGSAFGLDAIPINLGIRNAARGNAANFVRKLFAKALLWLHAIRHLRGVRAIIVPGTGILDDFRIGPFGWPYDLFCWFLMARLMGVKVILVSIGAGPIRHTLSRWLLKSAARLAHYRSYRDEASKSFMTSIGFDVSSDPIFPDLAFNLPTPANLTSGQPPLMVGVGVMTYYGWGKGAEKGGEVYEKYIATITAYVDWLLAEGHRVRILIGDKSDFRAAQDIIQALGNRCDPAASAVVFTPATTLHEIMHQMAEIDLAIVTRFHNVVCALKMGKPIISIGYAPKNDVLLAELGLDEFCQHIERLDLEKLKSQTARLISGRSAFEREIRDGCARFESRLREQDLRLAELIRDRHG